MATTEIANQISRHLRDGRSATETVTYVAVPGGEQARWLLPAANPEIVRVLAAWTPYRMWSRIAWTAVRAASQLGRTAEVPGVSVLETEGTREADWRSMGWRGKEPPIPVIYLGTPGPRRKAVVHLVDRVTRNCRAVVKVPLTKAAQTAILHEAEMLELLAAEMSELSPRLLYVDQTRAIATQAFVEGRSGPRQLTPEYWRLLRSLLLTGETTTLAKHAKEWGQEIDSVCSDAEEYRSVASAVDELRDKSVLPACWEHGDFAPWNIRQQSNGKCVLLDWEDARRNGLPLQDAYHFLHMQDWLFTRRPRLHAAEVRENAIELRIQPKQCGELEIAYLVSSYLKCIRELNHKRARFVSSTLTLRLRTAA